MLGICNNCGEEKEIDRDDEDGFCQNCRKKTNQDLVIQSIKDGFNLSLDRFAITHFDEYLLTKNIGYNQIEDFAKIFEEIEKYFQSHPREFTLGRLIFDNTSEAEEKGEKERKWWSPFVLNNSRRSVAATAVEVYYRPPGKPRRRVNLAQTRKIEKVEAGGGEAHFFIHPSALTEEQYERLKNALPNDVACKVKGCCNNLSFNTADGYGGPLGQTGYDWVENGFCQFHQLYPDYQDIRLGVRKDDQTDNARPRKRDLKIKIDHITRGYAGNPHFLLLSHSINLTGYQTPFYYVSLFSDSPLLENGKEIVIKGISFGPGQSEVDEDLLTIKVNNFDAIEEAGTNSDNPNPPLFPETQSENQNIAAENDNLAILAFDLLTLIEANNELVQKAHNEKQLNLLALTDPDGSALKLDDFENKPLQLLDESLPLNSPANQKILTENQKNKQRKEDFANRLRSIYQKNQAEYQKTTPSQGNGPSLENRKTAAIFQIESKQVDLKVLAGGKYRNYQSVIEGFTKEEEIENYQNEILAAIAQSYKEQENNHRPPTPGLIDQAEKEIIKAASLKEAKQKAVEKFTDFLAKIGLEENQMNFLVSLNNVPVEARNFRTHFQGLDSKRSILEFYKYLKREVAKHMVKPQQQNNPSQSPENNLLTPILVGSLLILIVLVSWLVLITQSKKRTGGGVIKKS